MSAIELHHGSAPVEIDQQAILAHLKLNPRDPQTQALLLVCDRYGLDPILKHAVLIQGTLYVTRDGLLSIAHRSGQFDGIELLDEGETQTHWTAKVSVYRKDMGRPFTYSGRYPKSGSNKTHGPEMAVKCAEVMALRRAFNVTGIPAREEAWDIDDQTGEFRNPAAIEATVTVTVDARAAKERLLDAVRACGWEYDGSKGCPAVAEATRIWNGHGDDAITESLLEQLLADVFQPPMPTAERKVTSKQAQRLHTIAGDLDETVLRVLIFSATNGISDSASDVPVTKYDTVCAHVEAAKDGVLPNGYAEVADRYTAWVESHHDVPVAS